MYNILNDIHIMNGETKRMNCPSCNGYKTFTVSNNMGNIMWNCYKASCNLRGTKRVNMDASDIKNVMSRGNDVQKTLDNFVIPEYIVSHDRRTKVTNWTTKWNIDIDKVNVLYDVKEERVVFPVMHEGKTVDATGRALGNRLPKWKRYGNSGLPYCYGNGNVGVVVEDCVSAVAAGDVNNFVGVALLGTSLTAVHKQYLTQFSSIIIALDPDALTKTLEYAKQMRTYVRDVRVLKLTDDLKYRNEVDIQRMKELVWN